VNVQRPGLAKGYPTVEHHLSSSDRFQALLEFGAAALYSCDAAGVITYYNKQATALWGCVPAPGDTEEQFCRPIMLYRANGEYLPFDQCPVADILAGKVPGIYDAKVYVRRRDGTLVALCLNIVPIMDDRGSILGAVSTFCGRS
jgi:PAS domain-containing protein